LPKIVTDGLGRKKFAAGPPKTSKADFSKRKGNFGKKNSQICLFF
jgi:hypothetical protein